MVTARGQALSSLPTYTLSLMLSVIELCKTPHQCGVHIGLYTLSSRRGLHMGCCIVKGYPRDAYRGYSLQNGKCGKRKK